MTRFFGRAGDELNLTSMDVDGLGVKYDGKLVKTIRDAASLKALEDWRKTYGPEIDKLPPDWLDELRIEFVDRQAELKRNLAA